MLGPDVPKIAQVLSQLASFALSLLGTLLILLYYRRKTVPQFNKYRTFGPRFWSGWVDGCVLWPINFLALLVTILDVPRMLAALLVIVSSLAWLVYSVTLHARFGQTVGKRVTRVRVVDNRTEGNISWRQSWLRDSIPFLMSLVLLSWPICALLSENLAPGAKSNRATLMPIGDLWLLSALPLLWFVAEILTMLTNEKRRALHDFIAGTVVIRTNLR